jgi:hypothetical protein
MIATDVLAAVRATPGVHAAFLNRTLARLVVTVDADGPSAAELSRIVANAERRGRTRGPRQHPASLPGDDAVRMGRMVAAAAATVGLGLSLTGSLLVGTQLAQTLVDSHGRLVVLTTVGSVALLAVVVTTPGLSHVFGCTPRGPLRLGSGLAGRSGGEFGVGACSRPARPCV